MSALPETTSGRPPSAPHRETNETHPSPVGAAAREP